MSGNTVIRLAAKRTVRCAGHWAIINFVVRRRHCWVFRAGKCPCKAFFVSAWQGLLSMGIRLPHLDRVQGETYEDVARCLDAG